MSFAGMRTWYDRLSMDERSEIDEVRKQVGDPTRILPESHGSTLEQNLRAAEKSFMRVAGSDDPFFYIRFNDTALGLLSGGYPIRPETHKLEWKLPMCGLARDAYHLREECIAAAKEAHLLGVCQNWDWVSHETAVTLAMLGIELPCERAVESWAIRHLLIRGLLFSALAGKNVVLIGHLAEKLAAAFQRQEFVQSYGRFGPIKFIKVVGAIETSPREKFRWEEIGLATEKLRGMDFDVALIAFGGLSKVLAYRIWKMGKSALDVGGVFDALLSVDPYQRSKKVIYDGATWPAVTWNGKHE